MSKENKDKMILARVTSDMKAKILNMVEQKNITISEYIISLIEKDFRQA